MHKYDLKIRKLLGYIKSDLIKIEDSMDFQSYETYAHDAFEKIERDALGFFEHVKKFTPSKERKPKFERLLMELVNLDKREKLLEEINKK